MAIKRLTKDERKKQIQTAAKEVMLEKGFVHTTMDDVITRSGMSIGGVYHYYKSTSEILYDIMSDGNRYRSDIIHKFIENTEVKRSPKIVAEVFVAKMLADNDYIPLYVMFLSEKERDARLKELFEKLKKETIPYFAEFLADLGYENLSENEYDFLTNITNASLLGCEILKARSNFLENKQYILSMLEWYFSQILKLRKN